jgi:methionyl aminopeptidase
MDMSIGSEEEFKGMAGVGKVVSETLMAMKAAVKPGISTHELDAIGLGIFEKYGAVSAPHVFYDFPGTTLISINDEVVHGIPGERVVKAGDLVTLDVTAQLGEYIADAAVSVTVPTVLAINRRLCACAHQALRAALKVAKAGRPIHVIGRAIEQVVNGWGFSVIPDLSGHGIGRVIHEEPNVLNFYHPKDTQRLTDGLVITIEPIICTGQGAVFEAGDGWTMKTMDGSMAAHFEHTLVITKGKPIVLTAM